MNCLILGGNGFIGCAVTKKLLNAGHNVTVLSRTNKLPIEIFQSKNFKWISGDYKDENLIKQVVTHTEILIHLISTTIPQTSNLDPTLDIEENLIPTVRLLEYIKTSNIRKVIFASSGGTVYGPALKTPIEESHPTNPISSYGIVKLAIEKYLLLYKSISNIQPIILRISNPYGDRYINNKKQGAINVFLNKALNNETIEIWGDGNVIRDYIHVDDVAEVFLKAINYSGKESIFNIGSGLGLSINKILNIIEIYLQTTLKKKYVNSRNFDVLENILCNQLAKNEFGWTPKVNVPNWITIYKTKQKHFI